MTPESPATSSPFTDVGSWARWLVGALVGTVIALSAIQFTSLQARVEALESTQQDITKGLITLTANQQMLIKTISENGVKLDEIRQLVYKHMGDGPNGR